MVVATIVKHLPRDLRGSECEHYVHLGAPISMLRLNILHFLGLMGKLANSKFIHKNRVLWPNMVGKTTFTARRARPREF